MQRMPLFGSCTRIPPTILELKSCWKVATASLVISLTLACSNFIIIPSFEIWSMKVIIIFKAVIMNCFTVCEQTYLIFKTIIRKCRHLWDVNKPYAATFNLQCCKDAMKCFDALHCWTFLRRTVLPLLLFILPYTVLPLLLFMCMQERYWITVCQGERSLVRQ